MTIHVVTDSAADLPKAVVAEHGFTIVPLTVRFGDTEITDGTLTPQEFWERCKSTDALPTTSAPSPGDFEKAFRNAKSAGADGVICVTLAAGLSATHAAAEAAAAAIASEIPVRVVDSKTASIGVGLVALAAHDAASSGASLDDVEAAARHSASVTRVFAALDTLENLKKGGRIGGAQAMIGSLLSIKPIIEIGNGAVDSESKQRTRARSIKYLADKALAAGPHHRLGVVHGEAPDVQELVDLLAPAAPESGIMVADIGAVIGAHSGPRVLGVTFQPALRG